MLKPLPLVLALALPLALAGAALSPQVATGSAAAAPASAATFTAEHGIGPTGCNFASTTGPFATGQVITYTPQGCQGGYNVFLDTTAQTITFTGAAAPFADYRFSEFTITGITETYDGKALFINIQHPGEDTTLASIASPTSSWPYSNTGSGNPATATTAKSARPRSATIVLTRTDGGVIGGDFSLS